MSAPLTPEELRRYDLHFHSRHSYDSLSSPRGIIRAARRAGLAGIAVTDHGTIAGGLETQALAPDGLLVIVGAEIYTDIGDVVCLFLTREIAAKNALEVIDETHRQGGVAFLPHPLRSHPKAIPAAVLEALDGYEALNARAGFFDASHEVISNPQWRPLMRKSALGNSDAHFSGEIGRAYTMISGPPTAESVRRAILEGRVLHGGVSGGALGFYGSQLVKMVKTRDAAMLFRLARRLLRKGTKW
jgi:predicted metal-dependent phosphoesterase TrpH